MKSQTIMLKFPGTLQLLTIAFVVLKLIHRIDWSWWWVLSPLWIPFILGFLFYLFLCFSISR